MFTVKKYNYFLFLLSATLCSSPAYAFDTPIHGDITREVLSKWGMDKDGTNKVIEGNLDTDRDPEMYNTMHAHFCNEEFELGSERLRSKLKEALESLARCDRNHALLAIGTSLHAI